MSGRYAAYRPPVPVHDQTGHRAADRVEPSVVAQGETTAERFLLDNALDLLEQIEIRVAGVDEQLLQHARISEPAKLLMTIPGVDVVVAIGLLAAIDHIERFPSPQKLAAYFGLVPCVRQSANHCYRGRITKAGSSSGRALAIEAFYSDFVAPGKAGPGAWTEIDFQPPRAADLDRDWSYLEIER